MSSSKKAEVYAKRRYDILDPNYKVAYEAFIAGYKEGYIKGSNDCNDTINQFYYLTSKI